MFSDAYAPYIPYGSNDLDPVVNANILRVLRIYNDNRSHAAQNSIQFIEDEIIEGNYDYAATYYPNRYHMPYYVSKAYHNSVVGLKESSEMTEQFIVRKYEENGIWSSRGVINSGDSLQSTILAVNTLLNVSGIHSRTSQEALPAARDYIFQKVLKKMGRYFGRVEYFFLEEP
jgi:predicted DNA-binding helix-hairpin-helix protein